MAQHFSKIMAAALASSALTAVGAPTLAVAQTTQVAASAQNPNAPQNAATVATVVITGSHVVHAGFIAPTPTVVLGQQEIVQRAEINTIDLLSDLPQFYGNSNTETASEGSTTTGGQSFANMRDLGANRTLVLFNGQRFVPTTGTETVDIAMLPDLLINRIDVVTGGASAAYGSDAVAGVTNFGIDTNFRGLKGDIEGGATDKGDGVNRKVGFAVGGAVGDRLSYVLSAQYFRDDGVPPGSRVQYDVAQIANPAYTATNGQPATLLENYAYEGHATNGGLIVGGPLAGIQFLPGGGTSTYTPCSTLGNASLQICPGPANLPYGQAWEWLSTPVTRYSSYGRLTYEVNAGTSIYADMLVSGSDSFFNSVPPVTSVYGLRTISINNAYLPASIVSLMTADHVNSFSLGSGFADLDNVRVYRNNYVSRGSLGFSSDLGGSWKADGYATWGQSVDDFILKNDTITANFNNALAAVKNGAGQIVCQDTLTNPNDGCVPLDVFGGGAVNPAAQAYITGTGHSHLVIKQLATAINLHGDLFSTWAGPVSVAAGGEYRWEGDHQSTDAISAAKGFVNGNPLPYEGENDVKEAYGEAVIPLARDVAFFKSLEVNVAGRVTDYKFSGVVETWKLGLNYEPIQGLRFRATKSLDIRAPNLTEILGTGSRGVPVVLDPENNNQQVGTISYPLGNPNLLPEAAHTDSFGVVLEPTFLPGFEASVDYYSIRVQNSIGTLTAQQMLTLCDPTGESYAALGAGNASTPYCSNINRNSNGSLNYINLPELNLGTLYTDGIDIEARYTFPLWSGDHLTVRALATNLLDYRTQTNVLSATLNVLGVLQPRWTGDLMLVYNNGDQRTFTLEAHYLGAGVFSNTPSTTPNLNNIPAIVYLNAGVEQKVVVDGKRLTLFFNVKNMLDQMPPFGLAFTGGNYDLIGRRFETGVRFTF